MVITHPTWLVQWDDFEDSWRVSDPDLEAFIRILRWNGVTKITVVKERL